ncbi:hypothetical protein EB796_023399 [Bugula neritina]|uniref:Uncharacterized protein n=1 Tax=Bugula neritina TaxID=10212 RepID=A0A7J7IWM8_BUGNE|nr:hypothetical protein EB796_023399 [Bugula neritina]
MTESKSSKPPCGKLLDVTKLSDFMETCEAKNLYTSISQQPSTISAMAMPPLTKTANWQRETRNTKQRRFSSLIPGVDKSSTSNFNEYKLGTEIQNQKTKPDAVKDGLEKKPVINQIKHNTHETPMVQRALPNRSTTAPNKTKSLSAIYNAQSLNAPNNQQTYTNCREDIVDQEILTDEPDSAYATLKKRRLQMSSWHNANPENQDISSEIIPPEVPVKNYNRI